MNKFAHISLSNPGYHYSYKGFCSIITAIIDIALEHYAEYKNFNCIIEDDQTLSLFDQINYQNNNIVLYDAGSVYLERLLSDNLLSGEKYNAHMIANVDNLKLRNFIFNNILKIKSEYNEKFSGKFKNFNITENTLGIHIRGTDKITELPEIKLDNIILKINNYLENKNIDKIFLSTDDMKYVRFLKDRFGDFVTYDDSNLISDNSGAIHFNQDRIRANEEALASAYILSRCNNFIYCFSNLSFLALIMGIKNFKSISNLNN